MLFMATNRRIRNGVYGDEERPNFRFEYQYHHKDDPVGSDGFERIGKRGFEVALLREMHRLRDEERVNTPKVGVYLHGFNNNYQASIDEIFDLEKSLTPVIGYSPIIVGFSWPSSGKVKNYLSDREEVRDSVGAFTRFLKDINDFLVINERDCFATTYCIAHSMGNYLLRKGMEYLSDYLGTPKGRKMFDETVMMAPDLASSDIEANGKGRYIARFSRRVHVYYSKYDRALRASSVKRFGGNRLGRHGANNYQNIPSNLVLIDARKYANSDSIKEKELIDRTGEEVSVHSSHRYHPDILSDAVKVLSSIDRDLIPKRERVDPENGLRNHYILT